MYFGPDKCVKVTFKKSLRVKSINITLDINSEIIELNAINSINIYGLMKLMVLTIL